MDTQTRSRGATRCTVVILLLSYSCTGGLYSSSHTPTRGFRMPSIRSALPQSCRRQSISSAAQCLSDFTHISDTSSHLVTRTHAHNGPVREMPCKYHMTTDTLCRSSLICGPHAPFAAAKSPPRVLLSPPAPTDAMPTPVPCRTHATPQSKQPPKLAPARASTPDQQLSCDHQAAPKLAFSKAGAARPFQRDRHDALPSLILSLMYRTVGARVPALSVELTLTPLPLVHVARDGVGVASEAIHLVALPLAVVAVAVLTSVLARPVVLAVEEACACGEQTRGYQRV